MTLIFISAPTAWMCIYRRPFASADTSNSFVHLVHAGTFYLIWGLWWTFLSFWTCLKEPQEMKNETHAGSPSLSWQSVTARTHSLGGLGSPNPSAQKSPSNQYLRLSFLVWESFKRCFLTGIWPDASGHYNLDRLCHISIYLAFVVSGVVDLLSLLLKLYLHTLVNSSCVLHSTARPFSFTPTFLVDDCLRKSICCC